MGTELTFSNAAKNGIDHPSATNHVSPVFVVLFFRLLTIYGIPHSCCFVRRIGRGMEMRIAAAVE